MLVGEALHEMEAPPESVILLAYFPGKAAGEMRREWPLVSIARDHIRIFLELQREIYGVAAGRSGVEELRDRLSRVTPGMSHAVDRLAAWAFATYIHELDLIRAHLEAAEATTSKFSGVKYDREILL